MTFQGGTRGVAIVNGGVIPAQARGTKSTALTSIVDWFATTAKMASSDPLPEGIDSVDLWDPLINGKKVNRTYVPLNVNYDVGYPNSGQQVKEVPK